MAVTTPALRLDGVRFAWTADVAPCLAIQQLQLARGERIFLHGPSGSGKSTLLGLVGGVLQVQAGSIEVLGTRLESLSSAQRDRFRADHIGFIFQQFNLIPYLSALDNLLLPTRFSTRRRVDGAEARRLLEHLEIAPDLYPRRATALSVGQQQRVAAARALIGRPELIVADEPTSALDAARQQGFLRLLLSECAQAGSTLIFVSHDARLAPLFDRSVALDTINSAANIGESEAAA